MCAYKEAPNMTDASKAWNMEHSIETAARPEAIWALFRDVPGWKAWNAGIEHVEIDGPFAKGTWFTMKPPGQDALRSQLLEVRENECFVDETRVGDLVVKVAHRIIGLGGGRTRVTYSVDAVGPGAAEIGPAIAADFPEVLAALAEHALGTES
jgi:hypothetical protein